jgi:hypothetical protein
MCFQREWQQSGHNTCICLYRYSSDLPEPPTNKRKMEPSSEHTASDHLRRLAENNSRVQNYFPGL